MEWVLDISVFNFSFFGKLVFNSSLFNCVGFSNVGLSNVGFSNVGKSNLGAVSYTHLDVYKRQVPHMAHSINIIRQSDVIRFFIIVTPFNVIYCCLHICYHLNKNSTIDS